MDNSINELSLMLEKLDAVPANAKTVDKPNTPKILPNSFNDLAKAADNKDIQKQITDLELETLAIDVTQHLKKIGRDLQFRVEKDSGKTVITVLDSETKEVIREIPPEQSRVLARVLQGIRSGTLFNGEF